jgi:hypothetical protein
MCQTTRSVRIVATLGALVAAQAACGADSSESRESQSTSPPASQRTPESSSGGASDRTSTEIETSTTTCFPAEATELFKTSPATYGAKPLSAPPCAAGTAHVRDRLDFVAEPRRFTTLADVSAAYCTPSEGAEASEPTVDFAVSDVVAVMFDDWMMSPQPVMEINGQWWLRRSYSTCVGGAGPANVFGFYVVPKGQPLNLYSCVTTCVGTDEDVPHA